jgi:drug/metabolite transporter (DMT)-like permease
MGFGGVVLSLVATYAYVDPLVAVLLGRLILAEPVTTPTLVGGAIVVGSVAAVIGAERVDRGHRTVRQPNGSSTRASSAPNAEERRSR